MTEDPNRPLPDEEGEVRVYDAPERTSGTSGTSGMRLVWIIIAIIVIVLLLRWIF